VHGFLDARWAARALVLTGGSGIGKTTCWEAGIEAARERGFRVLAARPAAAEVRLSFAAIGDLVGEVDLAELEGLPAPQRRALDIALLRAESGGDDLEPHAVAAGFLGVLRALAAREPLLIAVDDLQWLDPESAHALAYAGRRLGGARAGFLLASRPRGLAALVEALGRAAVERLELGPLHVHDLRRLLDERLGLTPPRRLLLRIADSARGNPLFALELGRVLAARGLPEIGEEIVLPEALEELLRARVDRLPLGVRRLVLTVALAGELRPAQVEALAEPAELEEALDAGLLLLRGDRVRLESPLLGAALRKRSRARERRELHLRLAGTAGAEQRRARHLALAARGPDAELAARVAAAAGAAAARGASLDAAELARHALRLTPPAAPERADRLLALAEALDVAGEDGAVTALLAPELERLPHGTLRARALIALANAEVDHIDEAQRYLARALDEGGSDPGTRAAALALSAIHRAVGMVDEIGGAEADALAAIGLAHSARPQVQADAVSALAWTRALRGAGIADLVESHGVLAQPARQTYTSPDRVAGVRLIWRGEVEAARTLLTALLARADERAEAWSATALHLHLCELALRAGDWDAAARRLAEWHRPYGEEQIAGPIVARCAALLAAGRGHGEEAERHAHEAIAGAAETGLRWDELEARRALGLAALLALEPERAADALGVVWDATRIAGVGDPGVFPVAPDLVEALVASGRPDQARAVASALAEHAHHPWARVAARRCAGLLENDEAALLDAAAGYRALGLRFDAARTLLALGTLARRRRGWGEARLRLEQAAAAFAELGSPGWAERARADLARVGGRRPRSAGELTPAERGVTERAAAGQSNKEIAQALGVSVHTVEAHLSRAYPKLGVRSRSQLLAAE
jgi:DNA-binding CsgD family transcriptional regulator